MLENIKLRLECIESGAPRSNQETYRRETQQEQPTHRDDDEEYTNNEEDQGLYSHVRTKATQTGTSRAQQQR